MTCRILGAAGTTNHEILNITPNDAFRTDEIVVAALQLST